VSTKVNSMPHFVEVFEHRSLRPTAPTRFATSAQDAVSAPRRR
jgi:hypothetical protein